MNVRSVVHLNGTRIFDSAGKADEQIETEFEFGQTGSAAHYEIDVAGTGSITIDYVALPRVPIDQSPLHEDVTPDQRILFEAITNIVKDLLTSTVDNHQLIKEVTHELAILMLSIGSFAKEIIRSVNNSQSEDSLHTLQEALALNSYLFAEAQVGMYTIHNFLSHFTESNDPKLLKPRFDEINLQSLLSEMIDVYSRHARFKDVDIEVNGLEELPKIRGIEGELRRAFHNVLNNAVKYSYHSIAVSHRIIRIRVKVPYDPGFSRRRFAVSFENYGLGTTQEEARRVFEPGFRGKQAIDEVAVGSGIGLSEVRKIMKLHSGDARFISRELYDQGGKRTYLTKVDLIFPY